MHEQPETIASPPPRRRLAVIVVGVLVALVAIARGLDHSHKPSSGVVTITHDRPVYTPHQNGAPIPATANPATGPTPPTTIAP